jgi:hypothetical protein
MHKRARSWANWLVWAVLLLMLAAGGASLAGSQKSEADRESLKNEVSGLKSQAGVGRLVAEQALAGNLTHKYVAAQSGQMLKNAEATRDKLSPEEFEPALSARVLQAGDLARRLGGALGALRDSGGERQGAESARQNLAGLFKELSELEEGLKQ